MSATARSRSANTKSAPGAREGAPTLTQPVRQPVRRRYSAAHVPIDVVRKLTVLMQSRSDVPEAHIVTAPHTQEPTLVVVADDSYLATVVPRLLRTHLPAETRPAFLLLDPTDADLAEIRALGGELKRGPPGVPGGFIFGP